MQSFIDFLREDADNNTDFTFNPEGYYVYFIMYRSAKKPTQFNLYVGVKHKDKGNKAVDFFGGIRHATPKSPGQITFTNSEKFFTNYFTIFSPSRQKITHKDGELLSNSDELLYMSSCVTKDKDSLSDSYRKGISEQDPLYHPLIAQNKVHNKSGLNASEFFNKIKPKIIAFFSKDKKTEQEKVQEDARITSTEISREVYLPIEISKGDPTPSKLITHAKSDKYGYRVYVCDDMSQYLKHLKTIEKNEEKHVEAGNVQRGLKGIKDIIAKWDDPKQLSRQLDECAEEVVVRHYLTLLDEFGDKFYINKPSANTEADYYKFIRSQFENAKNGKGGDVQVILSQLGEADPQKAQQGDLDKKEQTQAFNAGPIVTKASVVAEFYSPPHFTSSMKKRVEEIFVETGPGSSPEEKALRERMERKRDEFLDGKPTYDSKEKVYQDIEGRFKGRKKTQTLQYKAACNFSAIRSDSDHDKAAHTYVEYKDGKKEHIGIVCQSEGKKLHSVPCWNEKGNPLIDAVTNGNKEAIKELREMFLKYDAKLLMSNKQGVKADTKKLFQLGIRIVVDGKLYYVIKNNKKLSLIKHNEINITPATLKDRFYNLYDFLQLIGFKNIKETDKVIDVFEDNKLDTAFDRTKPSFETSSVHSKHFDTLLNEYSGYESLNQSILNEDGTINVEKLGQLIENDQDFSDHDLFLLEDSIMKSISDKVSGFTKKLKKSTSGITKALLLGAILVQTLGVNSSALGQEAEKKVTKFIDSGGYEEVMKEPEAKEFAKEVKAAYQKSDDSDDSEESKDSGSTQSTEINQRALDFITELYKNPNQFQTVFFDTGSGDKPSSGQEVINFLFSPVRNKKSVIKKK